MDTFSESELQGRPPTVPGHDPVRCLGSGGQGAVWLMAPRDGSRHVAAKILAPSTAPSDGDSSRGRERNNVSQLTQEWRVLAQFRHDHLLPVQRLLTDEGGDMILLMDYAAGGSLAEIVRAKGPLTVGEAVTVLTPMGQVLAFLHSRGAIHGDVSPGNILLSSAGKPFLADFGFGRLLGQTAGETAGTPGFQCPSDSVHDESADVFALAAVGWFVLTGRPAPPARDRLPLSTFVPDVPVELLAALEAGLHEVAAQRPTAAAFAQAVFRSARAEPVLLGNAVHPSVLPELATRPDVRERPRRSHKPGRAAVRLSRIRQHLFGAVAGAKAGVGVGVHRSASDIPPELEPHVGRRWRRTDSMTWASEAGVVRRRRTGHWGRLAIGAVAVSATVALALVLLNGSWFGVGGGAGDEVAGSEPTPPGGEAAPAGPPVAAWASGLPAEIQEGLWSQEPIAALHALAWVRAYGLSTVNSALLAKVNVPGSPALEADDAIAQELKDRGHSFTGLQIRVSEASTDFSQSSRPGGDSGSATDPPRATVSAVVSTSAFAEQDGAGTLVHRQEQEQRQSLDIVLMRVDSRWAIEQILPAG